MSDPKVLALVLNWNGYDDTSACLVSLADVDYPDLAVLVVDNGSEDGSAERLQAEFPSVEFLSTGKNLGYAGGNNAGFRWALERDTDYVLVLNNDTLVEPDCVRQLVDVAVAQNAGIVSAKIFYEWDRKRLWFAGGHIDKRTGNAINEGLDEVDEGQFAEIRELDFASGCAMLVRRDVIEQTDGFDEDYFLYFEEVDFCLRAVRHGCRIAFAPRAIVWHRTLQETGKPVAPHVRYYMTRNRWRFMRRLYDSIPAGIAWRYVLEQIRIGLSLIRRCEWVQFRALWCAHRDAARGRYGIREVRT